MADKKYVDKTGLAYFWSKIKALFDKKVDKVSSTANAIPRFNGTGGNIKDSSVTLSDGGTLLSPAGLNGYTFTPNNKTYYSINAASIAGTPIARAAWHNWLSFKQSIIVSKKVTTDGTTWTDTTKDLSALFINKENNVVSVLTTSELGIEIILQGFSWSSIAYWEFGFTYQATVAKRRIIISVSSTQNGTYTEIHNSENAENTSSAFCYAPGLNGNNFVKIQIIKTTNTTTGAITMSCIKAWTARKGNQGEGIENEFPYNWDTSTNLLRKTANSNLGTETARWNKLWSHYVDISTELYSRGSSTLNGITYHNNNVYLNKGHENSSTSTGSQVVMRRYVNNAWKEQWALASNDDLFVINPNTSGTSGQLTYKFSTSTLKLGGTEVSKVGHTHSDLDSRISQNATDIEAVGNIAQGKADREHTHSYNDLTDKPTLVKGDKGDDGKDAIQCSTITSNSATVGSQWVVYRNRLNRDPVVGDKIWINQVAGYLLTTKVISVDSSTKNATVQVEFSEYIKGAKGDQGDPATATPVVDNLTSDATTSALSAKQGKTLKGLIDDNSLNIGQIGQTVDNMSGEFNERITNLENAGGGSTNDGSTPVLSTRPPYMGCWAWNVTKFIKYTFDDCDVSKIVLGTNDNATQGLDTTKAYKVQGYVNFDGGGALAGFAIGNAETQSFTQQDVPFYGTIHNLPEANTEYCSMGQEFKQTLFGWYCYLDCQLIYNSNQWELYGNIDCIQEF